jgi:hypothetical protein
VSTLPRAVAMGVGVLLMIGWAVLPGFAQVSVSLPAATGAEGTSLNVAMIVGSLTGQNVTSYQFSVTYDPAIVEIGGVSVAGTLSSSASATVNTATSGRISVAWASATAISGQGTLIVLDVDLIGEGTSALTISDFIFNEGVPAATTSNGSVTVTAGSTPPVAVSLPTSFAGLAGTSVDIPITVGDVTGEAINAYQFTITYNPAILTITSASVAGTLSASAGAIVSSPVAGTVNVVWASATPLTGSGVLVNLDASLHAAGTSALTFTSATFNEGAPAAQTTNGQVVVTVDPPVAVTLSERSGKRGESLLMPVSVGDLTGRGVSSFAFTIAFNPALIQVGVSQAGTLSAGTLAVVNTSTAGKVTVVWASVNDLAGAGSLVDLDIDLLAEGVSALVFENFAFNEGTPAASLTNGGVTVTSSQTLINVSLPANGTGTVGQTLTLPMQVGNTTGAEITTYTFTLTYDQSMIQFAGADAVGTLSSAGAPTVETALPGQVTVSWEGPALSGSGVLVNVRFNLLSDGSSPVAFAGFQFNDGSPLASLQNGTITVSGNGSLGISLPSGVMGSVGEQLQLPVSIGILTGRNVSSFTFTVTYDAADLTIASVATEGTLMAGRNVLVSTATGQITVSYAGAEPLSGSGTLVHLVATLVAPGTSLLSFASLTFNGGSPPAAGIDGSITVHGVTASVQLIHNSPDAPIVDVYINDERVADGLAYAKATAFLEYSTAVLTIDVVNDRATNNTSPIATATVTLINDQAYVAVLNGLFAGSGKQALGIVLEETVMEAGGASTIDLMAFQGSPDAPPMDIRLVDDSGAHRPAATFGEDVPFGEGRLVTGVSPGLYHVELRDEAGAIVNTYRADLSRTAGSALLFMIQGFVDPVLTLPDLTITAYAPDGRALFLPLSTANEPEASPPAQFALRGNYPNPFNPTTTIAFALPEPAEVAIDVFDLLGRQVLHVPVRSFAAGEEQMAPLDASELASGTYVYRVTARSARSTYSSSDTLTLLK